MKKKICIINTGGTITMQSTDAGFKPGASPVEYYYENATRLFPQNEVPTVEVMTLDPVIDSANMRPEYWNKIAEMIFENYQQYDGFVILHGTDTMAYTGAALSFMLAGLTKPVILTGALLPITDVLTDAWENMRLSVLMAAKGNISEVCIFFHRALLRANRTTKLKSNGYGAFISPNYPTLAKVMSEIEFKPNALKQPEQGELKLQEITSQPKIAIVYFYPGISDQVVLNTAKGMDVVILKTFGSGNAPMGDEALKHAVDQICKSCPIVVNHTQCTYGRVKEAYETNKELVELDVMSAGDMTLEALITKLYYLSSCYSNDFGQIKQQLNNNLCGELT